MSSMQVCDIASIPSGTWRNGKGVTRTLAAEGTDWRVSIAEVERDGPYSMFEGMTRLSVILRGKGVVLRAGRLTTSLTPFAVAEYDGATAWDASLTDGPVTVLNVICKRHVYRPTVRALSGPVTVPAGVTAIVLAAGRACHGAASSEAAPHRIAVDQFAVFQKLEHPVRISPDPVDGKDGGFGTIPHLVIIEPATV
ncbi:HutD family protein [Paraburkholderia phymatum]|uniref:HutD/Ves family protein n=1 Tax=Paraburkholderia phymatum TaxID=148447 RepID=UPI003180CB38